MRRYGQYCGLARALDLVGERWTLLIVRELMLRPCRYTDLRKGLPGIATNLLADRLRELEAAGVIGAEQAPPPVATTLYSLTEWGAQLRPIVLALGRWGAQRLMISGRGDDQFQSGWAGLAAQAIYGGADLTGVEPVSMLIDAGGEPVLLTADSTGVRVDPTSVDPTADVIIEGDPEIAFGLLDGSIQPDQLGAGQRTRLRGDEDAFRRLALLTKRAEWTPDNPPSRPLPDR